MKYEGDSGHGRPGDPDPVTTRLRPYRGSAANGRREQSNKRALWAAGRSLVALSAVAVLVGTGAAWEGYHRAMSGVTKSNALDDGPKSEGAAQNILIMGLDSRLDEKGNPLPQEMYDALHAGDDSVGGYNSNVLILLHIPGDGSKATAISIPRDDYVTLDPASCVGGTSPCKDKIKTAYGWAYVGAKDRLAKTISDPQQLEQQAREAGRTAEIHTVQKFLGNNIPIDHFVEVTLVAFFQIAQAVQPITVCLNERTQDDFSGADFPKGVQDIDASQAMAFVRQRRDPDESLNFTDLDRTRRQQAFIVALAHKLAQSGAVSSPGTLRNLLDVAKQNIAIDKNLDMLQFVQRASTLVSGGITMYTLPVQDFGDAPDVNGDLESINIVDMDQIHGIVKGIMAGAGPGAMSSATPTPTAVPSATGITMMVLNGSGVPGLAARLETALVAKGFTPATPQSTEERSQSTLRYGSGAEQAAKSLATELGLTATPSTSIADNSIQLIVGQEDGMSGPIADLAGPPTDATTSSTPTSTAPPPPPVNATATGSNAPAPTDLSSLDGNANGVPCVK